MFEFSIARKYLVPQKKSLSTALISLMSVLVISLVVWLVLVFLSVTTGIEKNWLNKLTTLHAPIRISPTKAYYDSYYYKIDALSARSDYTPKTIGEKNEAGLFDPYSDEFDAELPKNFPHKEPIDPVKELYHELDQLQLAFGDYEISGALLKIDKGSGTTLSQMSYLLSYPEKNPRFDSLITEQKDLLGNEWGCFLPKNVQKSGIQVGDYGSLCYASMSALSQQEQRIPIRIKGFYDPGLASLGNKCVIVPKEVTRIIHSSSQTFSPDGTPTNGIFVWPNEISSAENLQKTIESKLKKAKISQYWKVETYRDFEFSKDLLNQFQSDRTLFLILAGIILIVACSNIISLLVLLVNDKKKEIAILETMGASFKSIALIFGTCGAFLGLMSCLIGTTLAIITLKNIDWVAKILSALQGRDAFNPAFFGEHLPSNLSWEALCFVLIVTPILSLLAGLIPAMRAASIRPSVVLRSE